MSAPLPQNQELPLAGLKLLRVPYFRDNRGVFCQSFSELSWRATGVAVNFVQDNFSVSEKRGTVRGLHFQRGHSAQAKLIQTIRGAIFDVVVDIRQQSLTFGQCYCIRLDEGGDQLFVPEGFAHGFMTLQPNTIVAYKVSQPYDPANEGGINWADRDLDIPWPATGEGIQISEKDKRLGSFADFVKRLDANER